jgi:polysaccharide pyruvyl transferase WcaK-like protein
LPLIQRIHAGVASRTHTGTALQSVAEDVNTASIKELIGMLDVALVSRFHAMVGALSLGVPVTVLGWSHKYEEVMARFGLEALVLDYGHSAVEVLRHKVVETYEGRQTLRTAILERLPVVQASARAPVLNLLEASQGGRPAR